jgi:hypothetical protein
MARVLKSVKKPRGSSIYHFVAKPMRVHWKSRNQMESSIKELDEHQRWKFVTCLFGSSPYLPSNFRMSDGNLAGITGQWGECRIGSFKILTKSGRSKVAKKGKLSIHRRILVTLGRESHCYTNRTISSLYVRRMS